MNSLALAITAKEKVKARMTLAHSDNKASRDALNATPEQAFARQQRQAKLKQTVDGMRSHPRFPAEGKATAKNVIYYGAYAIAAGYGNCLEMACAASWALNEQGRFNYDLVYYPGGNSDHVFVALDQHSDGNGDFPTDFANWDVNAVVCDPWADIACLARDYPQRWRARMQNWRIMGILIANLLPTHPNWLNVVDNPKKSYLTPG